MRRGHDENPEPEAEDWAGHYAAVGRGRTTLEVGRELLRHGTVASAAPPTTTGAIINVTKGIVGSGILALPNALKGSSVLVGIAGLLVTGAFSALGFLAIGEACRLTGCTCFRQAWTRVGGPAPVVDAVLFFECILACIGYVILMADYMEVALHGLAPAIGATLPRTFIVAVPTAFCILPLCLISELRALSKTSALGLLAITYSYLYVVGSAIVPCGPPFATDWDLASWRASTFPTLTTFVSAYVAHFLAPTIWAECQEATTNPTEAWARFRWIVTASFSFVAASYITFGLSGYLIFGSQVRANVLTNFPPSRADGSPAVWTFLCWLLMAMSFVLSYPLIFRSARDTATDILGLPTPGGSHRGHGLRQPVRREHSASDFKDEVMFSELVKSRSADDHAKNAPHVRPRNCRWLLAVAVMVLVTNAVGTWLDDLGFLIALKGALLGCPLCFVLPGIVLLRLDDCPGHWRFRAKALIMFGAAGGTLGLYFSLAKKAAL